MTIGHPHRLLARAIAKTSKGGTPLRHARGVVVSSTIGQTMVTLDGGATSVPAFNYGHTNSLPTGAVADVLLVGKKAYVLGSYDGDVPVGGLLGSATNSAFNSTGTVFTLAVPVVATSTYLVSVSVLATQTTSNSSISDVNLSASAGTLSPSAFRPFSTALNAGMEMAGAAVGLYVPASTATVTFTVAAATTAGTLTIGAANSLLIITRVA